MLLEYGSCSLTHGVLTTFLIETCSFMNSRLLVPLSTDHNYTFEVTLFTLLTQKSEAFDVT